MSGTVPYTPGTKMEAEKWFSGVLLLQGERSRRQNRCGGAGRRGDELEMLCHIWGHPSSRWNCRGEEVGDIVRTTSRR